jgi:FkbH-like protein
VKEPIRLVIWDLDETFWRGTLAEDGAIQYRNDTHEIVITLTKRGIMNSICSKNGKKQASELLKQNSIWDYFIFPSINWEPKGPRLRALLEAVQLRPESVLFIDDHPTNLREAEFYAPGIQTAAETIVGKLLAHKMFVGKNDKALSRLKHYKVLEKKAADASQAVDNTEFLRTSDIRVAIDYDVASNIDRAVELINRTNQLNFTNARLSEDPTEAAKALAKLISRYPIQAGLVKVRDKYGDYGYVGFFALHHRVMVKTLVHFCFSCRIMNMGIEAWLYRQLGSPKLKVVGEFASNPQLDYPNLDWITLESGKVSKDGQLPIADRIPSVFIRGGCELMPLEHYFRFVSDDVVGEFNFARDGFPIRIEHSLFLNHAIVGLSDENLRHAEKLGYQPGDFSSALTSKPWSIFILSFWIDWMYSVFRQKQTGLRLPFGWFGNVPARGLANFDMSAIEREYPQQWVRDAFSYLHEQFEHEGCITEDLFYANMTNILDAVPPNSPVFIIEPKGDSSRAVEFNRRTRRIAANHPNVTCLNMRDFIASSSEQHNPTHFDRMVYYRLFLKIVSSLNGVEKNRMSPRAATAHLLHSTFSKLSANL